MSERHLEGKTALVTGSVQGIGLAVATALASAGARVALHGLADPRQVADAQARVREAGAPEARFFDQDLRDPAQIDVLMDQLEGWGGADVLVNNAGVQRTAPLAEVSGEAWSDILAVNLSAAFFTMRRALPAMAAKGYGRVVNIASVHGLVASVEKAPYVTSKFGLIGLSRVAALEYAAQGDRRLGGVTVNCICPGWTETPIIQSQVEARSEQYGGDLQAGLSDLLREKQPSLRVSDPAEIGALALWLCHPIAHNITGAAIPIDGGWTSQ